MVCNKGRGAHVLWVLRQQTNLHRLCGHRASGPSAAFANAGAGSSAHQCVSYAAALQMALCLHCGKAARCSAPRPPTSMATADASWNRSAQPSSGKASLTGSTSFRALDRPLLQPWLISGLKLRRDRQVGGGWVGGAGAGRQRSFLPGGRICFGYQHRPNPLRRGREQCWHAPLASSRTAESELEQAAFTGWSRWRRRRGGRAAPWRPQRCRCQSCGV